MRGSVAWHTSTVACDGLRMCLCMFMLVAVARGIGFGCSRVPSPLLAPPRDWFQDFCGVFAVGADFCKALLSVPPISPHNPSLPCGLIIAA
jgi:hypothetical protein